ncbi:MAG: response regulator [Ignavibacteriales bacterium]|nr:response regulator [Ignavibacteriales bacterium]
MQRELNISEGKLLEFERDIKNTLYKESLQEIWLTGGLAAFTPEVIDTLRKKFEISRIDHSVIEAALLREFRKNRIRGTILVVDEDDKTLLEISSQLRSNFFAVIAPGNLEEVTACLKIATPNFILSEINFQSGPLGFDLYEFIRSTPYTKQIPFLFMTEKMDRNTLLIGKRLGVDEFIVKPIDYELLIETLNGKLRHRGPQP